MVQKVKVGDIVFYEGLAPAIVVDVNEEYGNVKIKLLKPYGGLAEESTIITVPSALWKEKKR